MPTSTLPPPPLPTTLARIRAGNRLLWWAGWVHLALFGLFLALSLFDQRQVLGLNLWIKPMKFALSIMLYVWTLAWLLSFAQVSRRANQTVAGLTVLFLVIETVIIAEQAARGQLSHFNHTSLPNAMLFSIMGVAILLNTLVGVYLLVQFGRQRSIPGWPLAFLWSIRLGLLIYLIGCVEGYLLVQNRAHTVGAADGGAGLPFLNWSTTAGDLRVAHFMGLHALQLIPLTTLLLLRYRPKLAPGAVVALATTYLVANVALLWQAYAGQPLLRW